MGAKRAASDDPRLTAMEQAAGEEEFASLARPGIAVTSTPRSRSALVASKSMGSKALANTSVVSTLDNAAAAVRRNLMIAVCGSRVGTESLGLRPRCRELSGG